MKKKEKEKKGKRRHGTIFNNENEARKTLYSGEKAVLIKENGKFSLYGTPSSDNEVIEKLKAGAEISRENDSAEVVVLAERMISF